MVRAPLRSGNVVWIFLLQIQLISPHDPSALQHYQVQMRDIHIRKQGNLDRKGFGVDASCSAFLSVLCVSSLWSQSLSHRLHPASSLPLYYTHTWKIARDQHQHFGLLHATVSPWTSLNQEGILKVLWCVGFPKMKIKQRILMALFKLKQPLNDLQSQYKKVWISSKPLKTQRTDKFNAAKICVIMSLLIKDDKVQNYFL